MPKMIRKSISTILCVSVITLSVFVLDVPRAKAWPVFDVPNEIASTSSLVLKITELAKEAAEKIWNVMQANYVTWYKILALLAVQKATALIIGGGKGDTVIRDYNNYLYTSPQQRAMDQMNIFFNTASRGRLSATNYEGVGPNYDAYLVAQARQSIAGRPFATNIQEQVTDPSQMFSGGNMKGIMSYMQCANNVACYTLTANDRYNQEFARAQDIARSEQQNGFLPRKSNGRITSPAVLAQNALLQIDQLGTQVIMNAKGGNSEAENSAALVQIAQGTVISIGARAANYYMSDDAGKQAIRDRNDQFPFSLSYNSANGIGINAGGITIGTGVGKASGSLQIGNTCATGNFVVDPRGAAVLINGQKQCCAGKVLVNGVCQ